MAVAQNPATIFITDLDGRIENVNEKFIETTGYTREETIGQDAGLQKPGAADEAVYRELWETISAGQNWWPTRFTSAWVSPFCWLIKR
ncbi:PAS domain S-box protein [Propionivibrio sp.]|uniref:PAS domain S-box protein n=1 Tax=Propionivibrio sp. TaxID=2212460 RepID=UPI003BF4303D